MDFIKRKAIDHILKFFGEYIEGVTLDSLESHLELGKIELKNLKFKDSALDRFHLPVKIIRGTILSLCFTLPWETLLSGKTVALIEIDSLLLQLGPVNLSFVEHQSLRNQILHQIHSQFEKNEEDILKSLTFHSESKKASSSFDKLLIQILDNIKVTIRNIHLRYEDSLTFPGRPYSFGVFISSISLETTDSDWKAAFIQREQKSSWFRSNQPSSEIKPYLIHKLGSLDHVGIYWNCTLSFRFRSIQTFEEWVSAMRDVCRTRTPSDSDPLRDMVYILPPQNRVTMKITHNDKPMDERSVDEPVLDLAVETQAFPFQVDRNQFSQLLSLNTRIKNWRSLQKQSLRRPAQAPSRDSPHITRAWWLYAFLLVRGALPSQTLLRLRLRYLNLLRRKRSFIGNRPDRPSPAISSQLDLIHSQLMELEAIIPSKIIGFDRNLYLSYLHTRSDLSPSLSPDQTTDSNSSVFKKLTRRLKTVFSFPHRPRDDSDLDTLHSGGSTSSTGRSLSADPRKKKSSRNRQQDTMWDDKFSFKFNFRSNIQFSLSTADRVPLASAGMSVEAAAEIRSHSTRARLAFDDLVVFDHLSGSPLLHHLSQPLPNQEDLSLLLPATQTTFSKRKQRKLKNQLTHINGPILIQFQVKSNSNPALSVTAKPIEVTWNQPCIVELLRYFQSSPQSDATRRPSISYSEFSTYDSSYPQPIVQLKKTNSKPLSIDLQLHSPKLRIPTNKDPSNARFLVFDAGFFVVNGNLSTSLSSIDLAVEIRDISIALASSTEDLIYLIEPFLIHGSLAIGDSIPTSTEPRRWVQQLLDMHCDSVSATLDQLRLKALLSASMIFLDTFKLSANPSRQPSLPIEDSFVSVPKSKRSNTTSDSFFSFKFHSLGVTLQVSPTHSLRLSFPNNPYLEYSLHPESSLFVFSIPEMVVTELFRALRPLVLFNTSRESEEDEHRQNLLNFTYSTSDSGSKATLKVGSLILRVDPAQLLRILPFCFDISQHYSSLNSSKIESITDLDIKSDSTLEEPVGRSRRLSDAVFMSLMPLDSSTIDSPLASQSSRQKTSSSSHFQFGCEVSLISIELMVPDTESRRIISSNDPDRSRMLIACNQLTHSEVIGFRFDAIGLQSLLSTSAGDLQGSVSVATIEIQDMRRNDHHQQFKTLLGSKKNSSLAFKLSESLEAASENILSISLHQSGKSTQVDIQANNAISFVSIDPIRALIDSFSDVLSLTTYFQKYLFPSPTHERPSESTHRASPSLLSQAPSQTPSQSTDKQESSSLVLSLNFRDPHLFLVENPSLPNSTAIVLKSHIVLSYEKETYSPPTLDAYLEPSVNSKTLIHTDLSDTEILVLFDMNSKLSHNLIDPFNVKINYQLTSSQRDVHKISVELRSFQTRVTKGDVDLLNSIIQAAVTSGSSPPSPTESPDQFFAEQSNKKVTIESKFLRLMSISSEFDIFIDVERICLTVLNDSVFPHLQVSRAVFEQLEFDGIGPPQSFTGNGSASISLDIYNPAIGDWEPAIEVWRPTLMIGLEPQSLNLALQSNQCLQFNLSSNMIRQVLSALPSNSQQKATTPRSNRKLRFDDVQVRQKSSVDYPLIFRNLSGVPLEIFESKSRLPIASLQEIEEVSVHSSKLYKSALKTSPAQTNQFDRLPTHFDLRVTGTLGSDRLPISRLPLQLSRPRFYWIPSATVSDISTNINSFSANTLPVEVVVFENSRFDPIKFRWGKPWTHLGEPAEWTDRTGKIQLPPPTRGSLLPSDKWEWVESHWVVDLRKENLGRTIDSEGWYFHTDFTSLLNVSDADRRFKVSMATVRRRCWRRTRRLKALEFSTELGLEPLIRGAPLAMFWDVKHNHDGSHIITLRSGVCIENNLPSPIKYRVNGKLELGPVEPGSVGFLPVALAQIATKLEFCPVDSGKKWSQPFDTSLNSRIHHQQLLIGIEKEKKLLQEEIEKFQSRLLNTEQQIRLEQMILHLKNHAAFTSTMLECPSLNRTVSNYYFSTGFVLPSNSELSSYSITVNPVVKILNHLPCPLCFKCSTNNNTSQNGSIEPGDVSLLSSINPQSFLALQIQIGCYQWSNPLSFDFKKSFSTSIDLVPPSSPNYQPTDGLSLSLVSSFHQSKGIELLIYSEFALIDRTGLQLSLHASRTFSNYRMLENWKIRNMSQSYERRSDCYNRDLDSMVVSTEESPETQSSPRAEDRWIEGGDGLTLFQSSNGQIVLSLPDGSAHSHTIDLTGISSGKTLLEVMTGSVSHRKKSKKKSNGKSNELFSVLPYLLSMKFEQMPGIFSRTRVLRVFPRYCIVNLMSFPLEVRQSDGICFEIFSESTHNLLQSPSTDLLFRCPSTLWSFGSIDINEIKTSILHLPSRSLFPDSKDVVILHVEVRYSEPTDDSFITVSVRRESTSTASERDKLFLSVKNESSYGIRIRQDLSELPLNESELSRFQSSVPPNSWCPFGWADPSVNHRVLVSVLRSTVIHSEKDVISIAEEMKVGKSWYLEVGRSVDRRKSILQTPLAASFTRILDESHEKIFFSVQAVGCGIVLFVRDHNSSRDLPLFQSPQSASGAMITSIFQLSLRSVALSIIAEKPFKREFISCQLQDLSVQYQRVADGTRDSNAFSSISGDLEIFLQDFQFDNYSETKLFPVLLSSCDSSSRYQSTSTPLDPQEGQISLGSVYQRAMGSPASQKKTKSPALSICVSTDRPSGMKTSIFRRVLFSLSETELSIDSSTIELFLLDVVCDFMDAASRQATDTESFVPVPQILMKEYNSAVIARQFQPCVDMSSLRRAGRADQWYFDSIQIQPLRFRISYFPSYLPREKHSEALTSHGFQYVSEIRRMVAVEGWVLTLSSIDLKERLFSWNSLRSLLQSKLLREFGKNLASLMISINVTGVAMKTPRTRPIRSPRVLERSELDEKHLLLVPLDVEAIRAQEVVLQSTPWRGSKDKDSDLLVSYVDLCVPSDQPLASIATSKRFLYCFNHQKEILFKFPLSSISHCELVLARNTVRLLTYGLGRLEPFEIPSGNQQTALKLYTKLASSATQMGQPWRTVPLDLLNLSVPSPESSPLPPTSSKLQTESPFDPVLPSSRAPSSKLPSFSRLLAKNSSLPSFSSPPSDVSSSLPLNAPLSPDAAPPLVESGLALKFTYPFDSALLPQVSSSMFPSSVSISIPFIRSRLMESQQSFEEESEEEDMEPTESEDTPPLTSFSKLSLSSQSKRSSRPLRLSPSQPLRPHQWDIYLRSLDEKIMLSLRALSSSSLIRTRALAAIILNLSPNPVQILNTGLREGRSMDLLGVCGPRQWHLGQKNFPSSSFPVYNEDTRLVAAREGLVVLLACTSSALLDPLDLEIDISTSSFQAVFSTHIGQSFSQGVGGATTGFLEKSIDSGWAKFVLIVM